MKVFVLTCEAVYECGDQTIESAVFTNREKAEEIMKDRYAKTLKEWDEENAVHSICENFATHYIDGEFSVSHIQWNIEETELITD